MKAIELRIGNLITDHTGNIRTVKGTSEKHLWVDENYGLTREECFLPIELTVEFLTKTGFNRNRDGWFLSSDNKLYDPLAIDGTQKNKTVFAFQHGNNVLKPGIRYVHQLQNLYFALTGEELQLKIS